MTQENIELLATDISARVKYGVYIRHGINGKSILTGIEYMIQYKRWLIITEGSGNFLYDIKPYLRPMSSMTEEEKKQRKELGILLWSDSNGKRGFDGFGNISGEDILKAIDWLNKHHFDYRGLIEKGLALEAPEGMYNIKEK